MTLVRAMISPSRCVEVPPCFREIELEDVPESLVPLCLGCWLCYCDLESRTLFPDVLDAGCQRFQIISEGGPMAYRMSYFIGGSIS